MGPRRQASPRRPPGPRNRERTTRPFAGRRPDLNALDTRHTCLAPPSLPPFAMRCPAAAARWPPVERPFLFFLLPLALAPWAWFGRRPGLGRSTVASSLRLGAARAPSAVPGGRPQRRSHQAGASFFSRKCYGRLVCVGRGVAPFLLLCVRSFHAVPDSFFFVAAGMDRDCGGLRARIADEALDAAS